MARPRLFLLCITVVYAAAFLSPAQRDLIVGDETKYGQVVREMSETGRWILPTLEGAPFTHKPPIHFWLIRLLTFPLGIYSTWAFVIPSLVAFAFLVWLMWRMSGPLAAFICATSLLVWASAQTARMDVSFTAFITLGVWLMERESLPLAAIALGIATLIKGPMPIVIAIVLFALEWWRRRSAPRGNYLLAIVLLIAIPMLWFVPAMMSGGASYTNDVLHKQIAGRAVGAWVHASPPWARLFACAYYLAHSPGFLFPWFALGVTAIWTRWREQRFNINWILAVLVPYSLMSSKLDVYMMALVPPLSIVIADAVENAPVATRRANIGMLVLFLIIGAVIPFVKLPPLPVHIVIPMIALAIAAAIGLFMRNAMASTIAVGLVPLVPLIAIVCTEMPRLNEFASTRRLIAALEQQHVAPQDIALYSCPYLWSRDMPRELEHVRYVTPQSLGRPIVVATSAKHANEIKLPGYAKTTTIEMIGKPFDVYRR